MKGKGKESEGNSRNELINREWDLKSIQPLGSQPGNHEPQQAEKGW